MRALLACLLWLLASAAQAAALRVGLYENPPKLFTNAQGEPAGLLIEILRAIAQAEHQALVFVPCVWQDCLARLERGELDLMPDVAYTEARSLLFDFHRTPALSNWSQLYRRPDVPVDSLLDLHNRRVAILTGSVQEPALQEMLRGFDIRFEAVGAASFEEAFRLVQSGRADVAVANNLFGEFNASRFGMLPTPVVFMPARLYFAAPRGRHAAFLAAIDRHLVAWQADPGSRYYEWVGHWGGRVPQTLVPPGMRRALLALIAGGAALLVGVVLLRSQVKARTAELEQVNRQLTATLDATPDLLFEVDRTGRYLDVHARRAEQLAAPVECLLGQSLADVLPAEAAGVCMAAIAEAAAEGSSHGREIRLALPQGERWFELSVARKPGATDTAAPSFIVLSRDITLRKQAERGLARMSQLYAALSQCNQSIVRCRDEAELLESVCQGAVLFGGVKMAWIGLLADPPQTFAAVAWHGEGGAAYQARLSEGGAWPEPLGRALREDRAVWCQALAEGEAGCPGGQAAAALPLHREGKVAGGMAFHAGEVGAFDEKACKLLLEMAMDIDFALERFRLDGLRLQMEAELAEREEKYRELTESINDVIWTLDPETLRFTYVSPSVRRLRGFTPEEVMAAPLEAALLPESVQWVRELLARQRGEFLAGERTPEDCTVQTLPQRCKDGSTVWTEVAINMVVNRRTGKLEVRGVTRDISERKAAEARIERLARFDQLTGLPNRIQLKDRFEFALKLARRSGEQLAVMFLDLDHFKNVNDTLGHDLGDRLLVEIARRLESGLRSGDTVSRLGGDEFIFLLPDTDAAGAAHVAEKMLEAIARPCVLDRHELSFSASIGIALYPDDGEDMDTLSRNADSAMYQVKHDSRNGFRFFTRAMQARSARTLLLAHALHQALEREQFSLHYQPQVCLASGRIVGAEALLRWQHPELGAVSPGEFIPIAESNGLIVRIGEWVLRQAAMQARAWQVQGLPPLVIAVNLSAAQFRHPDLPGRVTRIVEEAGLAPAWLELELTEAVAMDEPQAAVRIMGELSERGFGLSIDDFGTGYSSLSLLKRFKLNKLKIDQSFVRDIADDPDDRAIVGAIIGMAGSLGMKTIAEGVETAEQLAFLRSHGCDEVQGYYFARPLPALAFEQFVREAG